jgi:nucleoside-diphosphate-sugar epimerase
MKKVAVIGCGWLGLPLALELKSKGYEVFGYARREEIQEILETHQISVLDSPGQLLNIDVAISTLTPPKSEEDQTLHLQIAQAAREHQLSQLIYTSSISVYPDIDALLSEEDNDPEHPISKLEELYIGQFSQVTILRLGGLYGGQRHPATYLSGRSNVAKPLAPINLVSRERVIHSILQSIDLNIQSEIINIVDPEHPTRIDYYTEVCKQLAIDPPAFEESDEKGKIVSTKKMELLLHL